LNDFRFIFKGKEGKVPATPRDGNKTKTIIFSHEAQTLHKLVSF